MNGNWLKSDITKIRFKLGRIKLDFSLFPKTVFLKYYQIVGGQDM